MSNLAIGKSKINGNGLFTKVNIPKGTKMCMVADLNIYSKGGNAMTALGKLVNHKADANCDFMESDDNGLVYLRSIKNINKGEELTINYKILPFPFKSDVTGYKN